MGCVTKSIKDLKYLPSTNGLSNEIIPSTMITGKPGPDYNQICKLNFGDYVQAYRRNGATNTNKAMSVGAIALFPSGNDQNWLYFMSLATGKIIHCYQWDVLPVSEDVIEKRYIRWKNQSYSQR